jgi:DNA segregation ATPase FtsK/SpoIIIE, S-DNA-T family
VSNLLGARKTLELLDRLKTTVEGIAARANKLHDTFSSGFARESRRYETTVTDQSARAASALAEAEAEYQSAQSRLNSNFEHRKQWIDRAYQTSKEQGLTRAEDNLGAAKYDLQKKMLQAEKDRETGLATTTANFHQFGTDLAAEEASLAQLEQEAQRFFAGYGRFRRDFLAAYEKAAEALPADEHQVLAQLREQMAKGRSELDHFRRFYLLRLFKYLALWVPLALCGFALVPVLQQSAIQSFTYPEAAGAVAGLIALILIVRLVAARQAAPVAAGIAAALSSARRLHGACRQQSQAHYEQELERIKKQYADATRDADQQLTRAQGRAAEQRVSCRRTSDERAVRIIARNEQSARAGRERLEKARSASLQTLKQLADVRKKAMADAWNQRQTQLNAEQKAGLAALETEWKSSLEPIYHELKRAQETAGQLFPPWTAPIFANWTPPKEFAKGAAFGRLDVDVGQMCDVMPKDKTFVLPGPRQFPAPLCLAYPDQGSILIETDKSGHDQAIAALNNIILRLLSVAPPGRLNFTVIDPVGLGQNFAGVMHLADYEEQIINSRIWTQSTQIEEKLAALNEHMEKVIQMYLRNEYQTIAEYNEQAGVIAEKYHVLVVADFPANFTDTAVKRLLSIAASGARCGVYMLTHWDRRQPLPQEFIPDELRKASICLIAQGNEFIFAPRPRPGVEVRLEEAPPPELATNFIQQVGRLSRDSSRVEVPFEHVAPPDAEIWTEETAAELRVPIGRTGATKLQYLAIGKDTRQHGLIAGKTGSGKSTLFHVVITNLALWCRPDQVEFYLVDFKKGVEFKCYAAKRLPHARVVAIESDREFGLSVLQRVDDELKRRGDLFRQLGVQDLPGYKRAGGTEPLPRTLLLIDEFQEFFVEDDRISQTASLLLDRIVRQGRAFGIHVLLGSQTLGGAYTVARTTLGQMVIRIALQCNEADAYLIMDDSNPAPRLLSRPGEGIYNDMAGALEGNSPFQTVWLPEEVRDKYLSKVRARAEKDGQGRLEPIVFEGNAPADVRENPLLRQVLDAAEVKRPAAARLWLGAPNSIKGPTEAVFHRQSGSNLLIVGQRDEATLALFSVGLLALAAQYPPEAARFILLDATPPGTRQREILESVVRSMIHPVTAAKQGDLPELMESLAQEMKQRSEAADPDVAPPVFLFIHGLQRFGKLRFEEDFGFSSTSGDAKVNPGAVLNDLICEGTRLGLHVIASCDTYNNVTRFLSRKALSELEMRVLFQMSANDSASLIDNPKASMLGLHRALFYNAQEGYLETFRPYALPTSDWIEAAGRQLARLVGAIQSVGRPNAA